ncbi:MAG: HD-GYP domain-containing protein [bacterium]
MSVSRNMPEFICAAPPPDVLLTVTQALGWSLIDAPLHADANLNVALAWVDGSADVKQLRQQFPLALVLSDSGEHVARGADFVLSSTLSQDEQTVFLEQVLQQAFKFWRSNLKVSELARDVGLRRQRMHQLSQISLALTEQISEQELLQTLLTEARKIAHCEGGSLFLKEEDVDQQASLVFKLAQNDVVDFPFVESRLPLTATSIAGYVAATGQELNIRDVYQLSDDVPYQFNRSFDDQMGYRTRSMLTIPMRDHRERVVGVLQFVNRVDAATGAALAFDAEITEMLRAIASQAAVSIQKNTLLKDINELFESFVQASVKTIEQRDPATSGHSFRVAETTVALLQALPKSGVAEFAHLNLTAEHIQEVRYAALLHDFGKIGVPEAILVKPKKLTDERLEVIRYRFELQKERLRRKAIEQELDLLHHGRMDQDVARRRVHRQLDKQLSILDQYYAWVVNANDPNVVDQGEFGHLTEIRNYAFTELDGQVAGVISEADVLALSVRKGSLTPQERRAIQNHVVFTKEFLQTLPWPPELANVPAIAGAHHERIDGSGYPMGLVGEQIPLASRVMAVCDVYDALTAMDRPYKAAMSQSTAFSILEQEASRGLLDARMVEIFIRSGSSDIAQAV